MKSNRLVETVALVKNRRVRLARRRRRPSQRAAQISAWVLGVLSVLVAGCALIALPFFIQTTQGLPPIAYLTELLDPARGKLLQPTQLYDQSGKTLLFSLAPDGIERRFINASDVLWLAKAYVASNQPDFWTESGQGWTNMASPPASIAEHLVSRILLPSEPDGVTKNIRVHILANDLLEKYDREKILTWALNSTDFGYWAFGAESAAQLYFGKPASQLTLAESTLLAAVAQAPALNPFDNPDLAIRFQRLVLTSMREQGLISDTELTQAISQPLVFAANNEPTRTLKGFTELAIGQLEAELGHIRVINGNLNVTTTLDISLQQVIDRLLQDTTGDTEVLVLDPVNDRVLAVFGDAQNRHDPGNLFFPFTYLSSFTTGLSPASLVWDIEGSDQSEGIGPTTLRFALANQISGVESNLLKDPSIKLTAEKLVQAVGFDSMQQRINLLGVGRAFEIFSQNGLFPEKKSSIPNLILFVSDESDNLLLDHTRTAWQSIVSPETAYLVTDVLEEAAISELHADPPGAVFNDQEKSWWIAYSPQRIAVLWSEDPSNDQALLTSIFETAHQTLAIKNWDVPAGLISILVCVPSGQLPDSDCPQTRRDWFLRGFEPVETDELYQRIAINSANGKLATVYTPSEFVNEHLYLMISPEAESWAQAVGILLPPKDYDPIPAQTSNDSSPAILKPSPFFSVSGLVKILGSLGDEIAGYDVQVGQGLLPEEWSEVARGKSTPTNGQLASWDTTGLSGIWTIQLQAWNKDGRIWQAYTVVTIESKE